MKTQEEIEKIIQEKLDEVKYENTLTGMSEVYYMENDAKIQVLEEIQQMIQMANNFKPFVNDDKQTVKDVSYLIKLLKSKEAYDILDNSKAPDTTFQFGGCWILADALSIYYNLPIYVVYNKKKNIIEHFIVKLNSMFLDSNGIQSKTQIIEKVADDGGYDVMNLDLIEYNKELDSSDIIKDIEASKKLIDLFNK